VAAAVKVLIVKSSAVVISDDRLEEDTMGIRESDPFVFLVSLVLFLNHPIMASNAVGATLLVFARGFGGKTCPRPTTLLLLLLLIIVATVAVIEAVFSRKSGAPSRKA